MKIDVTTIDSTWTTCPYMWRVFVRIPSHDAYEYILSTLEKWFGDAEFFWGRNDEYMFLCGMKPGRERCHILR